MTATAPVIRRRTRPAETDMVDINIVGPSPRRDLIRYSIQQACVKCFTAVLVLLCLSQVAVAAGTQTRMLRQATVPIVGVRFTPSGSIISASQDGTVTMWNRDSDRPL